jgi:hypothetical protein
MSSQERPSSPETVVTEKMGVRMVALLLMVAALSVFVLWTVNPIGSGSETTFALFIAVDIVSVAIISYIQRSISERDRIGRAPVLAGCCFIVFLVAAAFYLLG